MVARMKATNTATRVFQYGLVPIGPFPKEGIDELRRANNLRNKLVEIDREHRDNFEQARADADEEYSVIKQAETELRETPS